VSERRGRISAEQTKSFLGFLADLTPDFDYASVEQVNGPVQKLCRDHGLTPYDALCIELAIRNKCPVATLDQAQKRAALALGVECILK
jgi:predicted nucleic acid-binding protein